VTDQTLTLIDDATQRLIRNAGALTDEQVAEDSLLPGWTRGHVLTHIARNADALRNLLIWARTGVETPAYASQQAREDDIEAGASRTAAELAADVSRSAEAFLITAADLPVAARLARVSILGAGFPRGPGADPPPGRGGAALHRPGLRLLPGRLAGRVRHHGPARANAHVPVDQVSPAFATVLLLLS